MKIRIRKLISVLLVGVLTLCSINIGGMKVNAAGATVTSSDGLNTYTLNHNNIKELDIANGSITITSTSYKVGSTTTAYSLGSDGAYVIKGTSTTNTIDLVSAGTVTIYFVDVNMGGQISINNTNANIIFCGTNKFGNNISANAGTSGVYTVNATSLDINNPSHVIATNGSFIYSTYDKVNLSYLDIRFMSNITSTKSIMGVQNTISNCNIYSDSFSVKTNWLGGPAVYTDCTFKNITLGGYAGTSITNCIADSCTFINASTGISSSTITNSTFYKDRSIDDNLNITDSYVQGKTVTNNVQFSGTKAMNIQRSTVLFNDSDGTQYYWSTATVDHSSLLSVSNSGIKAATTTKNLAGAVVYVMRFKVSGHPNEDVMVDFKDGDEPTKLKTDSNAYLYLYFPSGATTVCVKVVSTGETYDTTFPAVTADSTDVITLTKVETPDTSDLENQITDLQNQLSQAQIDISNITTQLNEANNNISNLTGQTNDLSQRVEAAQKTIDELTQQKNDLQSQITDLTNDINDALDLINQLQGDNTDKDTIIGQLTSKVSELQSQVNDLINDKNNLQGDVNTLNNLLQDIKSALGVSDNSEILQAIQNLKNTVSTLQSQLTLTNQQLTDAQTEISDLTNNNANLNTLLSNAQNQIDLLTDQRDSLQSQLNNANTTISDLQQQLTNQNSDISQLTIDIRNLNDTVTTLTNDNNELQTKVNNMTNLLDDIKNALGVSNNDDILNAIDQLKQHIVDLQQSNNDLVTKLADAKNNIVDWQDKFNDLKGEKDISDSQLQDALNEITNLQSQRDSLQSQIDSLTTVINNLNNQISNLETQITNKDTTISDLQIQIINLLLEISNKDNTINDLRNEINSLYNDIDDLNSLLSDIKNELGVVDNDQIIDAIKQLKESALDKESENQSLKDRITLLETDLNNEKAKNQDLNNTLDNLKTLVGADNNDNIQNKIIDIQDQLKNSNDLITTLTTEKNTLSDQVNTLIKKNQELSERVKELENLLGQSQTDLQDKIDALKQQVNSLENDKATLESSVNSLENQVTNLNDVNTNLQSQIDKLQSLLDSANLTIEQLREELSNTYAENQSLKSENEILKTTNSNNEEKIKELQDIIDNYSGDNDSIIAELHNKLSELESALKDTQIESSKKDSIIDEANKKIQDFIDLVANLQEQLKNSQNTSSNTSQQSGDTTIPVSEDTSITVSKSVSDTVVIPDTMTNAVTAKDGWELSTDPYSGEWRTMIDNTMSEGIYTFFTKGTVASLMSNEKGPKKKIVYVRNKSNPNVIYVCSYDPSAKIDTNQIVPSFECNNTDIVIADSENNTYDVEVNGKLIFTVGADFGTLSKKAILYQLVPKDEDFDPDGNWVELEGNTISITGLSKPSRLYIKYIDSNDNFVVDKTVGFKPGAAISKSVPTITMNKTIYKGQTFKLGFDNMNKSTKTVFTTKNGKIASVNNQGTIKGKKSGTTEIYCDMYVDGTPKSTVIVKVTVKNVVDDEFNYNLVSFQSSLTSSDTVIMYKRLETGKTTTFKLNNYDNVTYMSSNSKIATVNDKGVIKAKKKGSATITILGYKDKKIYSYQIVVRVDDGTKDTDKSSYLK